jgi:hypothetical protein
MTVHPFPTPTHPGQGILEGPSSSRGGAARRRRLGRPRPRGAGRVPTQGDIARRGRVGAQHSDENSPRRASYRRPGTEFSRPTAARSAWTTNAIFAARFGRDPGTDPDLRSIIYQKVWIGTGPGRSRCPSYRQILWVKVPRPAARTVESQPISITSRQHPRLRTALEAAFREPPLSCGRLSRWPTSSSTRRPSLNGRRYRRP